MSDKDERQSGGGQQTVAEDPLDWRGLEPHFRDEIVRQPGAEHLQRCFTCGVCTGSCPVSEIDQRYSPSRIMRHILLGMREAVLGGEEIWWCAQCFSCSFHCPQQVYFADIIKALRHLAVFHGYVSAEFAQAVVEAGRWAQQLRLRLVQELFRAEREGVPPNLAEWQRRVCAAQAESEGDG